jgi:hypothetical protein
LSRNAVYSWVEKFSHGRSKVVEEETEVGMWLKLQPENFYAADFEALVKRWDKYIIVGEGYVGK